MRGFRFTKRDLIIQSEVARWPLLTEHIARLCGFPSNKKAAERLLPLHQRGVLKRTAYFTPAMQGRPAFAYHTTSRLEPRTLPHTMSIAEYRVQTAEWQRKNPAYAADFFYTNEVTNTSGLRPDATIIVHKGAHNALVFVEIDCGTEPVTSSNGYSLAGKLRSYAAYFDAGIYQQDFAWAGALQGFRVVLIVPRGRVRQLHHVVTIEAHDFALITTTDEFARGAYRPVWLNHENNTVDLLGRPGGKGGDFLGEKHRPQIPTTNMNNPLRHKELLPTVGSGF